MVVIKKFTIITEGRFDAIVLKKLFKNNQVYKGVQILEASGYSSALSKVKSLITLQDTNILLVLDTDTTNKIEIKQKDDFVKSYINTTINKDNFKVFWAIPEFEIIFLDNKKFISKLTNKKLSKDVLGIAKGNPRKALETISKTRRENFIEMLNSKEVREDFFKEGIIKDISDYILSKQNGL